jgi:sulfur carrier protein
MIIVKINGNDEKIKKDTSILDFLQNNDINPIEVTVEYNFKIINSENISKIVLEEGDVLEVLRFVGGG